MAQSTVQKIQSILGATPDGIWGPKSRKALQDEINSTGAQLDATLVKVQKLLGVSENPWGINSQNALNNVLNGAGGNPGGNGPFKAAMSSFADPQDLASFQACKAKGKTDKACFKVGDNGIGAFGKVTSQTTTPMVAIHPVDATKRWGSMAAAAHRPVKVTVGSKSVLATVEDQLGVEGRVDLNPAAAAALGLTPPIDPDRTKGTWEWVVV